LETKQGPSYILVLLSTEGERETDAVRRERESAGRDVRMKARRYDDDEQEQGARSR
jgi:hypothetical protein